jgi:hypothetical protein
MSTDERKQEIRETRREAARLSRDIVQGMHRKEKLQVTSRQNQQYEFEIHALTELTILETAEKTGLTLPDLIKQQATDLANPDPKTVAKMRFLDEIIAAAQVGGDLTPEELRIALPASERARLFSRILEISGLGPNTAGNVEKFRSR